MPRVVLPVAPGQVTKTRLTLSAKGDYHGMVHPSPPPLYFIARCLRCMKHAPAFPHGSTASFSLSVACLSSCVTSSRNTAAQCPSTACACVLLCACVIRHDGLHGAYGAERRSSGFVPRTGGQHCRYDPGCIPPIPDPSPPPPHPSSAWRGVNHDTPLRDLLGDCLGPGTMLVALGSSGMVVVLQGCCPTRALIWQCTAF